MLKINFLLLFTSTLLFSEILEPQNSVDCLILQDENSIICKYEHERIEEDKDILVQWIDPNGELSRERTLIIPAGHGSIYDFRYIEGRMKGIWKFNVKDGEKEISSSFTLD